LRDILAGPQRLRVAYSPRNRAALFTTWGEPMRAAICFVLAILVALAAPARADECKKLKGLWIDLIQTPDGFFVPLRVNGEPHLFLLSLSRAYGLIDAKLAHSLNLPLKDSRVVVNNGDQTLKTIATAQTIQLGVLPRRDAEFLVIDHQPGWGEKGDGVLGANIIGGLDLELDLGHKRLGLFVPDHCPFVPYWPYDVAGSAPITITPTGTIVMAMKLDNVTIAVSLATGSSHTILDGTAAEMLFGVNEESKGAAPANLPATELPMFHYPFKTLTAGDVTVNNPAVYIFHNNHKQCGGVAGAWRGRMFGTSWPRCAA
jgi:hypothetical protein